ncbi:MAG: energy transducer TonB [Calditrichaeota bacterium]|nr:energy transducer TonB [Calditrichota bacterium]MCB9369918.1 energy transducer TonB [Calditrichota bacterium]
MNQIVKSASLSLLLMFALAVPGICDEKADLDSFPMPVGGMVALMQQVVYPKSASKDGIEGKVLISAVIDVNGKVSKAEIMSGVRQDLDQAALTAVQNIEWTPAMKNKQAVEAAVVVPVLFKLDSDKKK